MDFPSTTDKERLYQWLVISYQFHLDERLPTSLIRRARLARTERSEEDDEHPSQRRL
ncbi:hypothetical protein HC931_11600 [Candidatus Gracilibacteria bacterium]|nr:hypothetical protein [Candidatus Gracilibacteria bacterium]